QQRPLIDFLEKSGTQGVGDLKDGPQHALGQRIQFIGVHRCSSAAKLKCCTNAKTLENNSLAADEHRWTVDSTCPVNSWELALFPSPPSPKSSTVVEMDFSIRPMAPADWSAVRAVYLEGIATGNATFETEAPQWEPWDATHSAVCRLVAENADAVLGFAALSPVSARKVYAGVAEVS